MNGKPTSKPVVQRKRCERTPESALQTLQALDEPERYELYERPRYRFEHDRREFFKILGAGIVVCLAVSRADAYQEPRRRRGRARGRAVPQELGAWLHIDEAGQVTAYTGKVEIGQNARTSLSQAVAEELRLPIESIRMVMADTDLTPFDMGTSGSGTTPRMAPQLRRVAATARELLIEMAAKRLSVNSGTLAVSDGKVIHVASKRSLTFGELAKDKQFTKTVDSDAPVTPVAQWKTAGTSVPKVEGRAIVTGKHRYASDVRLPGMLFGRILRPPSLNATLNSVNLKEVQALGKGTGGGITVVRDGNFIGVAAPTRPLAEQAIAAIQAEWASPSHPVSDRHLFEDLKKSNGNGFSFGGGGGGRSNYSRGSMEAGLAAADHTLKATYTIAYIAHAPLEPRAAVAEWKEGKLTVWTGTQRPFGVRGDLALAFDLPPEKVRVITPDMGSGYGGKHTGEAAIEAARLAKGAGKPVKVVWTREEEFTWAYFRPAGVIDVAGGVRNDGSITAWDVQNFNSGPSALRPLYDIPHQRAAFHSSSSPLRQGSYRALAATANHFARESHIDDLARVVKKDPLEFRLQNLKDSRLRAVLQAAATQFGWGGAKKTSADRGFGIAGGSEKGSYVATCAEVAVDRSNGKIRVVRLVTAFECGAIVNPDHLKNQVEGAGTMGLGGALFEAIQFNDDRIVNPRFSRYRVPRFSDLPVLETVLLDRKDLPSAGAGETPIVAVAPAIGNAIFQATGIRLVSLPMAPQGLKI
ncbi:MAG TPA: molybdopterin cofactor-binding domain-containing protein [Planctomycetaceae bacterium]|jgi:isoquinoline 1-oxidoreductase|nr:molybdopterin cofactor-binding domain-containing protein [Planctomycetaceae bacterium]